MLGIPPWVFWTNNRLELLLGRWTRGKSIQVLRIGGLEYLVDHRVADLGSLWAGRPDAAYGRFVQSMGLPDAPSILDLGANVGGFPLLLHLLGRTPRQIVCVELNPITCAKLRLNVETNWKNATVINAAVSSDGRSVEVDLGGGSTHDSIFSGSSGSTRRRAVPGLTFDQAASLIDGPIDLCKIDIEQAEREVLSSESRHLESLARVRNLLIEIHPAEALQAVSDRIEASGLSWRGHDRGSARPALGVNWYSRER